MGGLVFLYLGLVWLVSLASTTLAGFMYDGYGWFNRHSPDDNLGEGEVAAF
jgi:hypothetical protein